MDPFTYAVGELVAEKYRVERVLGRGGMGIVVQALHVVLGHRVALKVLHVPETSSEIVERFLQEARIAARLPADHIVRVTDVGRTNEGHPYLVMELLEGNDLAAELARRGPLPLAEAVDIVLEVTEGVAEAHAMGLVHRDLKPANVFLVQRRGRVPVAKVLDFGLSKAPQEIRGVAAMSMTSSNSTFGTPQYMSPEQIRSTKDVDARTDQHALGLILFELIAGRPVFKAKTAVDLMAAITIQDAALLRTVVPKAPAEIEAAIARALEKDADKRFPTVAEFAAAIAPFGGPTAAATLLNVAGVFTGRMSVRAPPMAPSAPSDAPTHPRMNAVEESVNGFTSSDDPLKKRRRGLLRLQVLAPLSAVLAGLSIVAVLIARSSISEAPHAQVVVAPASPPSTPAAPAAPEATAAASTEPTSNPSPTVTPGDVAPEPVVEAPRAPPTARAATPERPVRAPPAVKKPPSAIQVFGGSRK